MTTCELIAHPACRPEAVERIEASICRDAVGLMVEFSMWGELHKVNIPNERTPARSDRLWETTCFEIFLRPPRGEAYFEVNLSPSGEWATYRFDGYRTGMRAASVEGVGEPFYLYDGGIFEMWLNFEFRETPELLGAEPWDMAVCAIIEEVDGRKSYWALGHGGGPPDFHNQACFLAKLETIAKK